MITVSYAIQETNEYKLLAVANETNSWNECGTDCQETIEIIDEEGEGVIWTTDSLLIALALLVNKKQDLCSPTFPFVGNNHGQMRVVAIHSFNGIQVVQSEGVPQDLSEFITEEERMIGNILDSNGEYNEPLFNHYKNPENVKHKTFYVYDAVISRLETYFEKIGKVVPSIKPNPSLIMEHCANTMEMLESA